MIGVDCNFSQDSINDFLKIEKQLNLLCKYKLTVQFKEDVTEENGQKVELIAMWLEYGQDEFNVHYPARPFFRSAIDGNFQKIMNRFIYNANQVATGNMQAKQCFEDIGKQVKEYIEKSIKEGEFAPLAESTIKARTRKGSGTQPLIDTRTMLNNLEYVIEEM